jgi:hypothetical protein
MSITIGWSINEEEHAKLRKVRYAPMNTVRLVKETIMDNLRGKRVRLKLDTEGLKQGQEGTVRYLPGDIGEEGRPLPSPWPGAVWVVFGQGIAPRWITSDQLEPL